MNRTIALTGATGFIGSRVARRLAAAGWQIRVLVRAASPQKRLAGLSVQWIEGDLGDFSSLCRLMHGASAAVHCAGAVRGACQSDFNTVNVHGVARMVRAAIQQHPVPRFLFVSSLAAREPHLSPYAASKWQGEQLLAAAPAELFWAAFRPPAVYGPGDRELRPLFRWIRRGVAPLMGSRQARFSLLFVEDLAEAVLQWLMRASCRGGIYELHDGHPNGYSWNEVVDTAASVFARKVLRIPVPASLLGLLGTLNLSAARICGYAPMLTPGKVRELRHADWVCDNTELNRETGWKPQTGLEKGLRLTMGKTNNNEKTP